MNREYHKWHSSALGRDMEFLVYGHAGDPVLVFPTSMGRFYQYEDFGMVATFSQKIESGQYQVFCVDSVDEESLYCFDISPAQRIARHLEYERYVIEEVVPFSSARSV